MKDLEFFKKEWGYYYFISPNRRMNLGTEHQGIFYITKEETTKQEM